MRLCTNLAVPSNHEDSQMPTQHDLRSQITAKIIEALERSGVLPHSRRMSSRW